MKKATLLILFALPFAIHAQENYGKTANLGLGFGYGNRNSASLPVLHFNYEFDVAKNITVAPFVSLLHYSFTNTLGNVKYKYRSTTVPIGVRGFYYLDELTNLDSKFDIYAGAAIGFSLHKENWDTGYNGPEYSSGFSPLYWDIQIGAEYHLNDNIGLVLDLSTGMSTIGIAIHK